MTIAPQAPGAPDAAANGAAAGREVATVASIARVQGEDFHDWPEDLFIPPDALEVMLEMFEGPLDLLLYLIRKQNMDILDIPVAEVSRQYVQYVEVMRQLQLDLAAEYLVMAATLAEIKSRMMLPRSEKLEEEGADDPRAALVRRLQEYERFRNAACDLDRRPRLERDVFLVYAAHEAPRGETLPRVHLDALADAYRNAMAAAHRNRDLVVGREVLSVRERMSMILERLAQETFLHFEQLFTPGEGRMGLVVSFTAILELMRENLVMVVQDEPCSAMRISAS